MKKSKSTMELTAVNVGIITALPEEYAAVYEVLGCKTEIDVPGEGAGRKYSIAKIKTKAGAEHIVAVALLPGMGNTSAAIRAMQMSQHCPSLEHILMVGIAGAIPNPHKSDSHVRLGDIVVSDQKGVIQYDFDKEDSNFTEHRHSPRPPSASLIEAVTALRAKQEQNKHPWEALIKKGINKLGKAWRRPKPASDTLQDQTNTDTVVPHPRDPERRKGQPKIVHGPIASANKLLKNPAKRDALRDKFAVKAVEMEGSGVADATWTLEKGYLVIRGTCDYCNSAKGDTWHRYAALAAAAYARCVIEVLVPTKPQKISTCLNPKQPVKKSKVKRPDGVNRERDLEQLKRVFYWLHPSVFDQFIERLLAYRITYLGLDFYQSFKDVVNSHGFHLHDPKLKKLVKNLCEKWSDCFRSLSQMDASRNGKEAYFDMPGDIPTDGVQEKAAQYLPTTAQPLSEALTKLQDYVQRQYLEIDVANAGREALAAYQKE
jgi:nucleoside phosphorylase